MLEEDAKKKWCPMARAPVDAEGYGAGNRFGHPKYDGRCLCIGSDCMMWEDWDDSLVENEEGKRVWMPCGDCGLKHE